MKDYPIVNAEYAKFFSKHKPARVCVAVLDLPLSGLDFIYYWLIFKLAKVEIDAIAVVNKDN